MYGLVTVIVVECWLANHWLTSDLNAWIDICKPPACDRIPCLAIIKTIFRTLPSTGFQVSCAYLSKHILEDDSQINELLHSWYRCQHHSHSLAHVWSWEDPHTSNLSKRNSNIKMPGLTSYIPIICKINCLVVHFKQHWQVYWQTQWLKQLICIQHALHYDNASSRLGFCHGQRNTLPSSILGTNWTVLQENLPPEILLLSSVFAA